jgi:transposase
MVETMDLEELKALINSLLAEIQRLKAHVHELETENAELKARLAQNSANSSKPPSSDGLLKKPLIKPALPKQAGKKPGGQPGHPGQTLRFVEQPDLIHTHQATQCHQCGLPLQGPGQVLARRQVFDLPPPRLEVTEHQLVVHQCACGCVMRGQFPAGVQAPVQYGPRIHAQSVLLNVDYRVPFAKIRQFWADLTDYGYNPATLVSVQTALDEQLIPIEEQVKEQLKAAQVCHFDETGLRVGGQLQWVHVASNEVYTHLFVHPKRGQAALLSAQSVFGDCVNWTVHDCWASYFAAGKGRHALCGAHLLRELAGLIEQGSVWAKALHSYLLEAYKASRHGPILVSERVYWRDCYEQLCGQANEEELPPLVFFKANGETGRAKRSKGRNLLDRLIRHQDAVLAFAFEAGVPFTNNQAERDLRPVKVKQRVSGCFRTASGGRIYARLSGFISTMRKQGRNVVDELASVLSGSFQWTT